MTIANKEFDLLCTFLKDMFQFEDHDLDFGIYRIIRLKRQFIQNFIDGEGDHSLRATVTRALSGVQNSQSDTARNWLSAFTANFGAKGSEKWQALIEKPDDDKAVEGLKTLFGLGDDTEREQAEHQLKIFLETRQLSAEQLEVKVYNHLLNFFELYYQNGDFGYNTRAASAFKVPYEADYDGSDILFHWKHKDSYYIKTGNGFHSVRCEIGGKWLEFRLISGGDEEAEVGERNNNKESGIKHYRFVDIAPHEEIEADGTAKTVWQVKFALSTASTPKVELYIRLWEAVFADGTDLVPYLHKKPGKGEAVPGEPLFNDLTGDYEKTDGGQVKGIGQLRIRFDKYAEELAKRDEFSGLGKNAVERQQALEQDAKAVTLWQLDRNLNKFYVGNDADYFIHKDLRGFLTREKSRFIKQVIFSDLEALLNAGEDNATTLIARAFNIVADTLIGFLAAIENFQKGMFELKKKVVDTHYLISVGKIPASFHERVIACEVQRKEWREVFKVDVTEAAQLAEHPTLVVDTSLFRDSEPAFQDDLLSLPEFDNLDEQTDGLLINSENWQALNLLQEKFRERVKCIYIDPPYNTGGDGFLYKDSFRHSSWASMISQGLDAAKILLSPEGLLFCSIDENEKSRLQEVSTEVFPGLPALEIIRTTGTPTAQGTSGLSNTYDSLLVSAKADKAHLYGLPLSEEDKKIYNQEDGKGRYLTRSLRMTGEEDRREDRPEMYYGVDAPDGSKIYPIGPGGYESRWRLKKDEYIKRFEEERIEWKLSAGPDDEEDEDSTSEEAARWKPYIKFYLPKTKTVQNLWNDVEGNKKAKRDLKNVVGQIKRLTPKPIGLIKKVIETGSLPGDIVLDYFAGTGTTACAVIRLNKTCEENSRKWILCEAGNVYETALRRIGRLLYSDNWRLGCPIVDQVTGTLGIVKIQHIEQYEDLLDNLTPVWDNGDLPPQIPVKYLFRPEQNELTCRLNLSRPFTQTIRVGKARDEKTIDLMETWCYLQGYWVKSRRMYREFDRPYLAVETIHGTLVVVRDIDDAEDDTDNLNSILVKYVDAHGVSLIQRLEVNHDADLRKLSVDTTLITAADFMRGAQWN